MRDGSAEVVSAAVQVRSLTSWLDLHREPSEGVLDLA